MENKKLGEIVSRSIISVPPATPVREAVRIMLDKKISCVLVLDGKKPLGIFTERNIVWNAAQKKKYFDTCKINELMSTPVVTAKENTDIYEAYNIFNTNDIRHLVVVNPDDDAIGVVTQSNIIENLGYEFFIEIRRISRIMTKSLYTVKKDVPVSKVLKEMARKNLSCAIIAEDEKPLGIITERDFARLLLDDTDLGNYKIGEVMSSPVFTIAENSAVLEAARIMTSNNIRRLVVVNEDGEIVGLSTQGDIIKELEGKYIDALKRIIKDQDVKLEIISKDLTETTVYLENILYSSVDMGVVAVDMDFRIVYFNPSAEDILGNKADDVVGKNINTINIGEGRKLLNTKDVTVTIQKYKREEFVFELSKNDEIRFVQTRISGIWDKELNLFGFVVMINDITEKKRAEEELAYMATHDSLTGLPNRVLFNDLLTHETAHASRNKYKLSVLFLDLDEFKFVNDNYGHGMGDKLLQNVSNRLKTTLRKSDTVARMGGDEFMILLPGLSREDEALRLAGKIVDSISEPFQIDGEQLDITTSVGIAIFPDDSKDPHELVKFADMAMYNAKNKGKNKYNRFSKHTV